MGDPSTVKLVDQMIPRLASHSDLEPTLTQFCRMVFNQRHLMTPINMGEQRVMSNPWLWATAVEAPVIEKALIRYRSGSRPSASVLGLRQARAAFDGKRRR